MANRLNLRRLMYPSYIARLLLMLSFSLFPVTTTDAAGNLPSGVSSVQATWLYGKVAIAPGLAKTGYLYQYTASPQDGGSWLADLESDLKPGVSAPAVIWLHGCSGPTRTREYALRIFSLSGYTVFAPDSFARPGRRTWCYSGNRPLRLAMRKEEIKYALSQIRNFPWVDQKHLVLAGFSEGSQAVAAWGGQEFRAHVLVGTDCQWNGGMPSAPDGVRVMNLVGKKDRLYGGGCNLSGSQLSSGSMVRRYPDLGHNILYAPEVEDDLMAFLESLSP